ncbi:hypothetical protein BKG92_00565 [Rodentibacter ratti]|uniref:Uncharacterized protein n=1 Tax=Rodentibacter ratti TaxID=1906745 RepID=A0A1V3L463_9PAST|nr:hypothetical protein [Rodentibacter ratti]OOF84400.1 hypothetical protein BKG92_00565 [Rodentibacter ratti]
MKDYIYFSFIIYIGLFVSELVISLYDYVYNANMILILDLFLNPLKFSLVGGGVLLIVNKVFPTKRK